MSKNKKKTPDEPVVPAEAAQEPLEETTPDKPKETAPEAGEQADGAAGGDGVPPQDEAPEDEAPEEYEEYDGSWEDGWDEDPDGAYEYEDEEEEPRRSIGARLFSASASLLRWIVLVAVLLALLVGGALFTLYRGVSVEDLPQYTVTWAGQTLEASGYDWAVPVTGRFLDRHFHKPVSDTPQTLELVEESHPQLVLPEYTSAQMTITDADGNTLFEGSAADYADFSFDQNGTYTVTLTLTRTPAEGESRQAEGSYTYHFTFPMQAKPTLTLSAQGVAQGSVIGVRLTGVLGDLPPTLTSELAQLPFTQYQGEWIAFLPVDYNQMAGEYEVSATVNGQTVTETVNVYGRQRRELDTYTIDGTSAIPYVGRLPDNMDFLWEINDPDIYWTGSFIQPVQGKIARDYAVLEYTDRLDPADPLNAAIPPELIADYNANIAPRRSINVTLTTPVGSEVVAPAAGRVVYAATNGSLGRVVVIEHGCGVKSLFYLLGRRDVDEGDFVTQGQQIGTTQGHVICEMRVGDIPVNPWDAWRGSGGLFFR